jgi:hypothetical protein
MISPSVIYLKLAHFPVKIGLFGGVGGWGGHRIFFLIGIPISMLLRSPYKFEDRPGKCGILGSWILRNIFGIPLQISDLNGTKLALRLKIILKFSSFVFFVKLY